MLLLFRFLVTILPSGLKPAIGPLERAVVRFRCWPHDCDLNFHLNAGRYVSLMDIARVELLARMRVLRPLLRRGWRPIAGGSTITYRSSVLPFERFTVESRVAAWDEKWFYVEQLVHRRNGSLAATGVTRMLLRGANGTMAPAQVLEVMGLAGLQSPEVPK